MAKKAIRPRAQRPERRSDTLSLQAAAAKAAFMFWSALLEEFTSYAQGVNRELMALGSPKADVEGAIERLSKLSGDYVKSLTRLPRETMEHFSVIQHGGRRRFGRTVD